MVAPRGCGRFRARPQGSRFGAGRIIAMVLANIDHIVESPITGLVTTVVLAAIGLFALQGRFVIAGYVVLAIAWLVAAVSLRNQPVSILVGSLGVFGGVLILLSHF